MNINWDLELEEYFKPKYIKSHMKLEEAKYRITTLQGELLEFQCSIEGYFCLCHQKQYQLPIGMLKEHSKLYGKAFNEELISKLKGQMIIYHYFHQLKHLYHLHLQTFCIFFSKFRRKANEQRKMVYDVIDKNKV